MNRKRLSFNAIVLTPGTKRNPWTFLKKLDSKIICLQAADGKQIQAYRKDVKMIGDKIKWKSYSDTMTGVIERLNVPKYDSDRPVVVRPLSRQSRKILFNNNCVSIKIKNIIR